MDHVLNNIECHGYQIKLSLLLQHRCPDDKLSTFLKNPKYLKIIGDLNELSIFKQRIEHLANKEDVLRSILFSFCDTRDFNTFALIRKEFDFNEKYIVDACCHLTLTSLKAFVDFIEIFKEKDSGVDADFIRGFIELGVPQLLDQEKKNEVASHDSFFNLTVKSDVFRRFLKVTNEHLCTTEKGEAKYAPYCHHFIKNTLEKIKKEQPKLFVKILGGNVDQNKEISEILREVFFAKDKYFLEYYDSIYTHHEFFSMLLANIEELGDFTKEQQDKLDKMILQGQEGRKSFLTYLLENKFGPEDVRIILFGKLSKRALKNYVYEDILDVRFNVLLSLLGTKKFLDLLEARLMSPTTYARALERVSAEIFSSKDKDSREIYEWMLELYKKKMSTVALSEFVRTDKRFFEIVNHIKIPKILEILRVICPFVCPLDCIATVTICTKDTQKILELIRTLNSLQLQTPEQFFLCNIGEIGQLEHEKFNELFKEMPKESHFLDHLANVLFLEDLTVINRIYLSNLKAVWSPDQLACTTRGDLLLNCILIFKNEPSYCDALINKALPNIVRTASDLPNEEFFVEKLRYIVSTNTFSNVENKDEKNTAESECLTTLRKYIGTSENKNLKHLTDAVRAIYLLETRSDFSQLNALYQSIEKNDSFLTSSNYNKTVALCLKKYLLQAQSQPRNSGRNMMTPVKGTQ